jgi:ribosome-binding protein aMBF1 (putative translation factor)
MSYSAALPFDREMLDQVERQRSEIRGTISHIEASARALTATGDVARTLADVALEEPDLVLVVAGMVRQLVVSSTAKPTEYSEEDLADLAEAKAVMARIEAGEELPIPYEFAMRIVEGESTVKVHREWRGMSQAELARKAKLTQGALSDIERGRRTPGLKAAKALAKALDVPIANIVMD